MGRRTSFHVDEARRLRREETKHVGPPQLTAGKDPAVGIDTVNLENLLREV